MARARATTGPWRCTRRSPRATAAPPPSAGSPPRTPRWARTPGHKAMARAPRSTTASCPDRSREWAGRADAMFGEVAREPNRRADVLRLVATSALRLAGALTETAPAEAERHARRAIAFFEPLARADAANTQARGDLG